MEKIYHKKAESNNLGLSKSTLCLAVFSACVKRRRKIAEEVF
jgi:hypothetical protein